jgi:hypothetical protein
LLDDGTTVVLPGHGCEDLSALLSPASWLTVSGEGLVTEMGKVITADQIGKPLRNMRSKPAMSGC